MFFFNATRYESSEQLERDFRQWLSTGRPLVIPLILPESELGKAILNEAYMKAYAGNSSSKIDVFFHDNSKESFCALLDEIAGILSSEALPNRDGLGPIIGSSVVVIWPKFEKIYCVSRLDEHPAERTRTLLGLIAEFADSNTLEAQLDGFRIRNCLSAPMNYATEAPFLVFEVVRKYVSKAAARLRHPARLPSVTPSKSGELLLPPRRSPHEDGDTGGG
ncbi:hypothetical protein [Azospirillum sp. sgz302134]